MPGTGHKAWIFDAVDVTYGALTPLECQVSMDINRTAEQIDLSHKNSDTKIWGAGSNSIIMPFSGRIEIAAEAGDPTVLAPTLDKWVAAQEQGTTVFVQVMLSLIKGTDFSGETGTPPSVYRYRNYSGIISSFNETYPDEGSADYTGELAVRTIEAL